MSQSVPCNTALGGDQDEKGSDERTTQEMLANSAKADMASNLCLQKPQQSKTKKGAKSSNW